MSETYNSPAPEIRIHRDKMKLAVTNIYPAFKKKSEQEVRQEISSKLYAIFKKYA